MNLLPDKHRKTDINEAVSTVELFTFPKENLMSSNDFTRRKLCELIEFDELIDSFSQYYAQLVLVS